MIVDHLLLFTAENTSDFSPSKVDKNGCEVTSEDLLNTEHEEVLKCNSNLGSEESDFESAGQDVAKSMMSLLLPQAVPLLRNASTDKEFTIIPSDMLPSRLNSMEKQIEVGYVLDVPASGKYTNTYCFSFLMIFFLYGCVLPHC